MTNTGVVQLIKENQAILLRERRLADRTPFVRPVAMRAGRSGEPIKGFTRDLSPLGTAVVSPQPWNRHDIVWLTIHSINSRHVCFKTEARWCEPYGDGWYVVGFIFR